MHFIHKLPIASCYSENSGALSAHTAQGLSHLAGIRCYPWRKIPDPALPLPAFSLVLQVSPSQINSFFRMFAAINIINTLFSRAIFF